MCITESDADSDNSDYLDTELSSTRMNPPTDTKPDPDTRPNTDPNPHTNHDKKAGTPPNSHTNPDNDLDPGPNAITQPALNPDASSNRTPSADADLRPLHVTDPGRTTPTSPPTLTQSVTPPRDLDSPPNLTDHPDNHDPNPVTPGSPVGVI